MLWFSFFTHILEVCVTLETFGFVLLVFLGGEDGHVYSKELSSGDNNLQYSHEYLSDK